MQRSDCNFKEIDEPINWHECIAEIMEQSWSLAENTKSNPILNLYYYCLSSVDTMPFYPEPRYNHIDWKWSQSLIEEGTIWHKES